MVCMYDFACVRLFSCVFVRVCGLDFTSLFFSAFQEREKKVLK